MPEENTRQTTIPLARAGEPFHLGGCCEVETVKVARDWLREQMKGEWEKLTDKSISQLFGSKQSFANSKSKDVGRDLIKKFLNSDWKEWEIQEALAQLDDDRVTPAAMVHFDKLSHF